MIQTYTAETIWALGVTPETDLRALADWAYDHGFAIRFELRDHDPLPSFPHLREDFRK